MFRRSKINHAVLALVSGAGALGSAAPALAQADAQLQRVEITGSAVRRIDAEAALPVQVLNREAIQQTGATSTVDLLQRLPAIQGSFGESGAVGGSSFGYSSVSIHNVGDTRTLVLLNGRRLASFGGQTLTGFGSGFDLNSLPINMIERVEILTDGASALYGSDAIAGVVNFITRRNITDGDATIGISSPQGGGARETRISVTKGFGSVDKDGFNVTLGVSHDERTKLDSVQRAFASTGQITFSQDGKNYRFTQGSASPIPANVLSPSAADPNAALINPTLRTTGACAPKSFRVRDGADDYCAFDFVGELEIYPERSRDIFTASATTKLGEHELFADLLYSRSKQTSRIAPVPGSLAIPATSPLFAQYLAPAGVTGDTLAFYRLYDLGKRTNDDSAEFMNIVLGAKGTLAGWDYRAAYTRSQSDVKGDIAGYPGARAIVRLRQSGLLNPFVGIGQQTPAAQAAIAATGFKGYFDGGVSTLDTLGVSGSRDLFQMPAGPAMLGAGVAAQREAFEKKPSLFAQGLLADPVAGTLCNPAAGVLCDTRFGDESFTQAYQASRTSYGAFAELVVPVTKSLELTGALRADQYSDFGSATTAKGAFRWTLAPSVLVRGSIGSGFRAPTVPQVNATQQTFGVTNSRYSCSPELLAIATSLGATCRPGSQQYDVFAGGNKALQPEKSTQATLGFRLEPTSSITAGVDWWWVAIRDSIGQITQDEAFANPGKYRNAWVTKVDTSSGATYVSYLQGNNNLGNSYASGLDFDAMVRGKLGGYPASSQLVFTYMLREQSQLVPQGQYYSAIGNFAELGAVTFRVQGRWTNTLKTGHWNHAATVNFKSGYRDQEVTAEVLDAQGNVTGTEDIRLKVKEYATLDLQTQYTGFRNFVLTAGVLNVFDTAPPLAISIGGSNRGQQFGYDDRYYDPRGRTFYVNASYKF